ncbi:MAG: gamma carbonic anhydrase family protein [Candidatus Cyclonatronum sp.]|uniref:gamma carbonic anhydrase family protein n=1 Tax=Cyclonatronum sp. TaxID=3024185 RepID=UPI0025B8BA5D|nr:gamma carbonic anhydrase family protein [Cyclonatronum sp.]MCC5935149.1 gamma carbonic anhydrase family protein [Balneolales bacterium]MCH8488163.1 gamma carbonic anhydrase family protein [Cyclonatronum sp.]
MIYQFLDSKPFYGPTNFIAPSADIIGDVHMGEESSVWFNCTIRGDVNYIRIGKRSNVQDNSCIHVMNQTGPTIIGDQVTIGHQVMLHGCTVHDRVLIGMSVTVLDKAVIEPDCIIGAGSLVTPGKVMPSGWLCMGRPAKPVRKLTDEELASIIQYSDNYVKYSRTYLRLDTYETNPFYTKPPEP